MLGFITGFFPAEMHRQTLVPHAREALATLAEQADIVILTNLADECRAPRIAQLAAFGIAHRVECSLPEIARTFFLASDFNQIGSQGA